MSASDKPNHDLAPESSSNPESSPDESLSAAMSNVSLRDITKLVEQAATALPTEGKPPPRIFVKYTRRQLLQLSKSPLIEVPDGMPLFKDWFGDWNDQTSNKKDSESTGVNGSTRDRRYRRDAEDGDAPTRPHFRTALSQPSQMGNFKHQSLRGSERDRERERDTERDLRTLSDKFDRERGRVDRIGVPSNSTLLRNRDRDSAPHLPSGTSNRAISQGSEQLSSSGTRREAKDAGKKKGGETSEDWRRGAEPPRPTRDDQHPRKDGRDDWDRKRSPARGSSSQRNSPPLSRRERDQQHRREGREDWDRRRSPARASSSRQRDSPPSNRRERDRDRDEKDTDRSRRGERDRDGRDSPEYTRRDKDRDRFVDLDDDSRRWRDDGKRDERMAQRRDRGRLLDDKDRELELERYRGRDNAPGKERDRDVGRDREHPDVKRDRELREGWTISEGREGRGQKRNHRDRRYGGGPDEGKDKERDDRKEREKEKEPAWMETYVPTTPTGGILGGKGNEGEVDSIQAWKKNMRERELREKGGSLDPPNSLPSQSIQEESKPAAPLPDTPLDEIQQFKLMMKREQRRVENSDVTADERPAPGPTLQVENGIPGLMRIREGPKASKVSTNANPQQLMPDPPLHTDSIPVDTQVTAADSSQTSKGASAILSTSHETFSAMSAPSSIAPQNTPRELSVHPEFSVKESTPRIDLVTGSATSRLQSLSDSQSDIGTRNWNSGDPQPIGVDATPTLPQFEPPRQSRLLAFGAQNAQNAKTPSQSASRFLAAGQRPSGSPSLQQPQQPQQQQQQQQPFQQSGPNSQLPLAGQLHASSRFASNPDTNSITRIVTDTSRPTESFTSFENSARPVLRVDPSREFTHYTSVDPGRQNSMPSAIERATFASSGDTFSPQFTDNRGNNPTPPAVPFSSNTPISPYDGTSGGMTTATYSSGKGSRFAKFFDGKARDAQLGGQTRGQNVGTTGPPSAHPSRQDPQSFGSPGGAEARDYRDILAMLNNSAQGQRGSQLAASHGGFTQNASHLLSQHQQIHPNQLGHPGGRIEPLYEADDGRFISDGMVPGLRPGPRSRETSGGGMFPTQIDDTMQLNTARLPPQQRTVDQLFSVSVPQQFASQAHGGGRAGLLGFQQQPPFRGGPSPINNFNPHQVPPQQRLPPGLANLGGRPPHEPSHFMGSGGMAMSTQSLHSGLQANSHQQTINQFQGSGLNFGVSQPLMRGPPGGLAHIGNPLGNGLGGLGNTGGVDFRGPGGGPVQLSVLGGAMGGSDVRGGGGFNTQHGGGAPHIPGHLLGMRQQQHQQHLPPPHMVQQMLPPHMQQQHGLPGGPHTQNDLMALLLGGAHRE